MDLFDPIKRSEEVEAVVMKGISRAYYRFRHAPFYGPQGIVTADAIGCNLLCAYCWNYQRNLCYQSQGDLFKPSQVALKLRDIARSHNCNQFRISGSEPFLGDASAKHIANIIKVVDGIWWIETNGLMIGYKPDIIKHFDNIPTYFRITIKGHDKASFEKVTGAKGDYYKYPLKAIEELYSMDASIEVALNPDYVDEKALGLPKDIPVERERLHRYKGVDARLKARGLKASPRRERPIAQRKYLSCSCSKSNIGSDDLEGLYQDLT